jgi:hypothetical protein
MVCIDAKLDTHDDRDRHEDDLRKLPFTAKLSTCRVGFQRYAPYLLAILLFAALVVLFTVDQDDPDTPSPRHLYARLKISYKSEGAPPFVTRMPLWASDGRMIVNFGPNLENPKLKARITCPRSR